MPDGGFPVRADSLLLELASQEATGCLTVTEPEGEQSSRNKPSRKSPHTFRWT